MSREVAVGESPDFKQCVWYTREERQEYFDGDAMWKTGKALSMLAAIVGFGIVCGILCTSCVLFRLPILNVFCYGCIVCCVLQMSAFVSLGSDFCNTYECTWSAGMGMSLVAAILWIASAVVIKAGLTLCPIPASE